MEKKKKVSKEDFIRAYKNRKRSIVTESKYEVKDREREASIFVSQLAEKYLLTGIIM